MADGVQGTRKVDYVRMKIIEGNLLHRSSIKGNVRVGNAKVRLLAQAKSWHVT